MECLLVVKTLLALFAFSVHVFKGNLLEYKYRLYTSVEVYGNLNTEGEARGV